MGKQKMISKILTNSILRNKPLNFYLKRSISGLNIWDKELTTDIKQQIENHWRPTASNEKYKFKDHEPQKQKYYVLSMFPYPSGHLHMGHVRVYTISDSIARYQRMQGNNVIHPIGWDAFGLPAENAAIDRKIPPSQWTNENIKQMKQQLQHLGCSFEWHRELATCDANYYKWTQQLFLKLFQNGLAYQKEALVNWDPVDCTVLADEQVDENGCSWRSGAKVEKKLLKQWFVKTTKFAKDLQDGLDDSVLQDWRDIIKLQKHWIGECNGIALDFRINNTVCSFWTDHIEYLEQIKFIALHETHLLSKDDGEMLDENTKLLNYRTRNPLTNEELPIFVTNNLEFAEGRDTHLGIPCRNRQDEEFSLKFGISFEKNIIFENSEQKRTDVLKYLQENNLGGYYTSSKLRDWLISRQRYWGTPIPIIHCKSCGTVVVPNEELPVKLPESVELEKSASFLQSNNEWKCVPCPQCGQQAERETDTMDTFVDSSWYFLRYLNVEANELFDTEKAKKLMPVDLYIGGKEHAVLHLYYARFISHFLHSLGLLPEREPFKRLLVQGMVMGRSYKVKSSGKYLPESDVNIINLKKNKAVCKETGEAVTMQWEKMSKSKFNGVNPEDMFKDNGVDTTRLLILADVAPTSHRNWNSVTFAGVLNWQRRLWITIQDFLNHRNEMPEITDNAEFEKQDQYMFDSRNYYIKGVTFNYCDSQQISIAISKLQGLTNSIRKTFPVVYARSLQFERALASQIIMLAPLAPHFASELWSGFLKSPNRLNNNEEINWDADVLDQKWPQIDRNYNMDLVVQINGTDGAKIKLPLADLEVLTDERAIQLAFEDKTVQEFLETRKVHRANYKWIHNYEGVVNIVASGPPLDAKQIKLKERTKLAKNVNKC